jgi:hypothetical protein
MVTPPFDDVPKDFPMDGSELPILNPPSIPRRVMIESWVLLVKEIKDKIEDEIIDDVCVVCSRCHKNQQQSE